MLSENDMQYPLRPGEARGERMAMKKKRPKKPFTKIKNPSVFQKIACAWWDNPRNPQIYGSMNVDMTECLRFIEDYNSGTWGKVTGKGKGKEMSKNRAKDNGKLTITHAVVKAAALAYRKYPELNIKVERNRLYKRNTIDVHLLVTAEGGHELSAIKMHEVDSMSLGDIRDEIRKGAKGVRANKGPTFRRSRNIIRGRSLRVTRLIIGLAGWLVNKKQRDLSWLGFPRDPFGTVMISSVGMFGIETAFAPLFNLARSGVVMVITEVRDRPWVVDGNVVVRPVMKLCGTFDHRIFTGHKAGLMAGEVKDILMNPERLLEK